MDQVSTPEEAARRNAEAGDWVAYCPPADMTLQFEPVDLDLGEAFDPNQARGPDGRWIKGLGSKIATLMGDSLVVDDRDDPLVKRYLEDLEKIPEHLMRVMLEKGVKLHISARPMTEMDENAPYKGVRPRGWPEGSTWDQVAGNGPDFGNGRPWVTAGKGRGTSSSGSVLLHELAHGLDLAHGWRFEEAVRSAWKEARAHQALNPYVYDHIEEYVAEVVSVAIADASFWNDPESPFRLERVSASFGSAAADWVVDKL